MQCITAAGSFPRRTAASMAITVSTPRMALCELGSQNQPHQPMRNFAYVGMHVPVRTDTSVTAAIRYRLIVHTSSSTSRKRGVRRKSVIRLKV